MMQEPTDIYELAVRALEGLSRFRFVGTALSLAASETPPPPARRPAAYVLPVSEKATPKPFLNDPLQSVQCVFGVLIAFDATGETKGFGDLGSLMALRRAAQEALVVLETDEGAGVRFREGKLSQIDDGVVWWFDQFESGRLLDTP